MTGTSFIDSERMQAYRALIASKREGFQPSGLRSIPALNPALKGHQVHSTAFALECGRAGLFLDTGLGKSFCELEFGRVVAEHTNRPVLMLAPLGVRKQHLREAEKWGIDARVVNDHSGVSGGVSGARVYITNYDRMHLFDPSAFGGVVLDESSILKSFTGKTSRALIEAWADVPFRLAGTATPAPNDYMELGQHSAFLGVMRANEMLTRWFIADQTSMGKYKIKRGAFNPFWDWVASWARCAESPSDLGFDDAGYVLPGLVQQRHVIRVDVSADAGEDKTGQGLLFRMPDTSATSIHGEKRRSLAARVGALAEVVSAEPGEAWIVWCDTDYEADALKAALPEAVEVRGSQAADLKEERLNAFSTGAARILITKPSVAGFGLNWQHCARMAFVGLSFKYEEYYQAIRRCYRFGQTRPVHVHTFGAETEANIHAVISRKADDHGRMKAAMAEAMRRVAVSKQVRQTYLPEVPAQFPDFLRRA